MQLFFIPKFFENILIDRKDNYLNFIQIIQNPDRDLYEYISQFSKYDITELISLNVHYRKNLDLKNESFDKIRRCHTDYNQGIDKLKSREERFLLTSEEMFLNTFSLNLVDDKVFILIGEEFPILLGEYKELFLKEILRSVLNHRGETYVSNSLLFRKLINLILNKGK